MNANGHQTLLRMFPIVDEETFVEFATYIYQRIGPIRILDEKERPDTVAFVKFYADQDHVKLFDYVFNAPRFTFEGKEHKIQGDDGGRVPEYVGSHEAHPKHPTKMVSARQTTWSGQNRRAVGAGPTGGETQVSGTDSAIGQPKRALGPGATPKKRGNCVINQFLRHLDEKLLYIRRVLNVESAHIYTLTIK
ncbi:hypothetical protein BpHYR1_049092 [Brachionus plicatilis]|uniref:Uncharacterized protein n=1 Tax=Brachionus plicatilis TaxID=10195 RepID=A0A3M7R7K6_BRAPC|nr:hypothetical protein BpHYR1_049092 [Brachionus plicatilis]